MPKLIDKDEKKRSIAIAALDLFAEQGIAKTSVDAIAKAAGVGKGTVYLYFDKKEEIISEIWDYVQELLDGDRGRRFDLTESYEEKLRIFFDFDLLFHQKGLIEKLTKIFAMNLSIILGNQNDTLKQRFKEHILDEGMVIKTLLDGGVKAGEFKSVNTIQITKLLYSMREGLLVCSISADRHPEKIRADLMGQLDYVLSTIRKD